VHDPFPLETIGALNIQLSAPPFAAAPAQAFKHPFTFVGARRIGFTGFGQRALQIRAEEESSEVTPAMDTTTPMV
jgi:hypothetical protein